MKCFDAKIKLLDQRFKDYSLQAEKSLLLNVIVGEGLKQQLDNAYDKGTQNKLYSAFGKRNKVTVNVSFTVTLFFSKQLWNFMFTSSKSAFFPKRSEMLLA